MAAGLGLAAAGLARLAPVVADLSSNRLIRGDEPTVSDAARDLHARLIVVDLHADTLLWARNVLAESARGHVDLPRLRRGGVALQVFSSVTKVPRGLNYDTNGDDTDLITLLAITQGQPRRTWTSLLERSLHHADKLDRAAADSGGALVRVGTSADLDRLLASRAAGADVTGALFSVEGLHNLGGDLANLDRLEAAGVRMAGFAHFFDNAVAGSMHGRVKGGLTGLGREVFDECERRGILVDLAHASHRTVEEMLGRATRPLVSSQGGVQATCAVNRNLTDDEIRGVAATGGVVGIGFWEGAVGALTPAAVVDAIEHVIDVGGLQTAALGSDYDGAVPMGWDTADLAILTEELLARGHPAGDVAAVMGGNAIRVLRCSLPE